MTIDPRNAIVGLFTNGMISATTEHGTVYVAVELREDNMNATMKSSNHAGLILLEQNPMTNIVTISIGGKTVMEMAHLLANVWIVRKPGMLHPDAYMKSILDTFENEIIDHHTDIDSDTRDIQIVGVQTLPSDSPELMRKAIMLTAWGYRTRP